MKRTPQRMKDVHSVFMRRSLHRKKNINNGLGGDCLRGNDNLKLRWDRLIPSAAVVFANEWYHGSIVGKAKRKLHNSKQHTFCFKSSLASESSDRLCDFDDQTEQILQTKTTQKIFRQFANTAQTESKLTNNIHSHLRCSSEMNFRSTLIKTLPIHCYDQRSRSPTFKLKKTCNLAKSPRLTLTTQKMVDAKQAWFLCEATFPACLVYFKSKMADCKRLSGQEKIVYFWLWFWGIPDVIAFITIWCLKINLIIGILKAKFVTSHLQKIFISFLLIVWIFRLWDILKVLLFSEKYDPLFCLS